MTRARCQRGSTSVEVAVAVPVLLLLIMLVVQFGLWYHAEHIVRAAADQGLRVARDPQRTAIGSEQQAGEFLNAAGGRLVQERQVTVTRTADTATVSVAGQVVAVVPGLRLPVRAVAAGPVERFRPDAP